MSETDATPGPPFVALRAVTKRYPGVLAVDEVTLELDDNHVVGLVGKNGAGKSTLIKILAGALRPDGGHIAIDGHEVVFHEPHQSTHAGLAFVHQDLQDVPQLTVAENVMLGLGYPRHAGVFVDWSALNRRAAEVLARLEVDIDPRAVVGSLSIAQRRMVVIARGLAQRARMVVLDEPTASLSDEEIAHLFAVIRRLRSEGVGIVYVSHRLDEIFTLTERVVVMRNARVVADETTSDLDRRALIALITGHDDAQTAIERRRDHGIGGAPDSPVVLGVRDLGVGRVHDCSFDVHAGEVLGIAGLVGAGRTELVRAVVRRRQAQHRARSRCTARPADIHSPESAMAAGIALLPEDRKTQGNVMDFSIRHNITLASLREHRVAPRLAAPSPQSERSTAVSMIDRLAISTPNDRQPVRLLSGGNQQKVVIAKWLAQGADLLIFDEPTHGVDVDGKEEIYRIAEELAAQGKSVIFISSEFSELVGLCHRVVVMREGTLIGELDGDEISERSIVSMCYGEVPAATSA